MKWLLQIQNNNYIVGVKLERITWKKERAEGEKREEVV
jgi:hypothetical protein